MHVFLYTGNCNQNGALKNHYQRLFTDDYVYNIYIGLKAKEDMTKAKR